MLSFDHVCRHMAASIQWRGRPVDDPDRIPHAIFDTATQRRRVPAQDICPRRLERRVSFPPTNSMHAADRKNLGYSAANSGPQLAFRRLANAVTDTNAGRLSAGRPATGLAWDEPPLLQDKYCGQTHLPSSQQRHV